ncbi:MULTISPECIES: DNA repair protein RadA [Pseudomonas]|uniref:DNA repair protein RadA n=1 Tax=Pseudomonas TaxID=286 RepID=UPI000F7B147D|nr:MULTISPECIES: DNA repair protein RadA [Pseudomonas]MBA1248129.1 DNA repair protein RadA [Pseudomonas zeshuii]MBW5411735.1 DNA repair protein RadA [Pseudomonas sp. MAG002Y]MDN3234054.1 DNA repair protein RadA [Pseudomonas sp. WAC2]QEU30141.1 DNA repair protein RadA [Pseudomonas luteola]RRW47813.1 DNA repair protein RadA [Pseudomonas luteola]
MAKAKRMYGCTECGATFPKWAGQCGECGAWNTLVETVVESAPGASGRGGWAGQQAVLKTLAEVSVEETPRFTTDSTELDRVLGGGLVDGSVVLIGGDPGIGKSTILLQTLCRIAERMPALYVTGEESQQQVAMRARRLGLPEDKLKVMTETSIESIIATARQEKPRVMVVDSIQTIFTEHLQSAPGGVAQVRESAALLVRFAKQTGTAVFLVGHVTKEGALAGPRVLEHMVDTVLYFEGESDGRLRLLRAVKNRFGAVNELGVFGMTDKGLKEVSNPSAIFLTRAQEAVPGSVVMATWEGSRPMLVEVQALVDTSHLANPRRVTVGLDQNRLAMLLAVLHRHGGIPTYDQDVFINVVGGVKVLETAVDLALMAAVISSLRDRPLPHDLLVFGEIGLSGEIRPVPSGQERLKEAAKHGFKRAIVPKGNAPKEAPAGLEVVAVTRLDQALDALFE